MRAALLVAVTLVACAPPREKFCEELTRAECKRGQRCGQVSEAVDCDTLEVTSTCGNGWNTKADYDEANARTCIDERASAACTSRIAQGVFSQPGEALLDWEETSSACRAVFVGTAHRGDHCGECGFCEAGLACVNGTCERWEAPPPAACSCGEGELCTNGACRPAVPLDAACSNDVRCERGLFCGDGSCRRAGPLGAACTHGSQCLSGMCFEEKCVGSGVEGEFCSLADRQCRDGFACERAELTFGAGAHALLFEAHAAQTLRTVRTRRAQWP
ncbi:MAG: DUF7107 domain-containing protein, partial [Archangium sp.]